MPLQHQLATMVGVGTLVGTDVIVMGVRIMFEATDEPEGLDAGVPAGIALLDPIDPSAGPIGAGTGP